MRVVSSLSHGPRPWRCTATAVSSPEARGGMLRSHTELLLGNIWVTTRAHLERGPQWAAAGPQQRWKVALTRRHRAPEGSLSLIHAPRPDTPPCRVERKGLSGSAGLKNYLSCTIFRMFYQTKEQMKVEKYLRYKKQEMQHT